MKNILFVCTGNTCRSPMATAIATDFFAKNNIGAAASSCGVYAWDEAKASPAAVLTMAKIGLDLTAHNARRANIDIMTTATTVITMSASHKAHLLAEFAQFADKIFTLRELCSETGDIADPFGGDAATYKACADEIQNCIEKINWRDLP